MERSPEFGPGCWVNLVAPTPEELARVQEDLGILPEFLRYPLDEEETSRVEREEDQLLIIVKIPDPRHEDDYVRYETIPLGIVLTDDAMVTVCLKETQLIEGLTQTPRLRPPMLSNKTRFIFQVFLRIAYEYLRHLRFIDRLTNEYEEQLHRSVRNKELIKLLNLEKSLVYFNTSLRANDLVMARLQSGRYITIGEEDEDILEDALTENQQAIEMAKIYSDILSGMMDAYASVISNNLNIVMKFLTSVTIVLMLPNLVASIYGMNVQLPFQHSPHAFAMTMGFSFVLSGIVVYVFIKKKMF
ncbi:magnesium transporter CorA family protein [Dissulfurirhabdus thermomarina]|uniref:Magnesium transporter CorA family protein n=1 Tax=Dissulfurirhabdus thermomarina TaxID=1765737 RepID=A0A6N9TNN9_DISTH|nr:magnesium transporter CorA family protein [Dissulfurirhabdus thermomarina]NDY42769.1 magnesium transporter CorA family protein [Dissulfurirhabdus thermomarina]NMX24110.1 magnesium transporter CorA family protein [Dissulfurirhabdus thermomarina]